MRTAEQRLASATVTPEKERNMPPAAADGQDFPAFRASEPAPYPGTPITREGEEQNAGPGTNPAPCDTDLGAARLKGLLAWGFA
jgi:hypothetical protein